MKTEILGVSFDALSKSAAKEKALQFFKEDKPHTIFTPNPEMVMYARKDKELMRILNSADMVIPDGIGIVYASKLNKVKIKERVAGYDLVQSLFETMKSTSLTVYFLGGAPGVAEQAKLAMGKKYEGLKIIGVNDGYFDIKREKIIIDEIRSLKPDLLLVGLGTPRQEKWIDKHKDRLPCKVLIGVGGSFDGFAGAVKRAPELFIKLNLEWLYRLIKQPSRIKRQIQLPVFVFTVIKEKILHGDR